MHLTSYARYTKIRSYFEGCRDLLSRLLFTSAAHLEAVGGQGEATKTALGFCTMFVFFVFVLKPKLISRSPSYI